MNYLITIPNLKVWFINEPHSQDSIKKVHMHSSLESGRTVTYWDKMSKKYQNLYNSIKQKYNDFNIKQKAMEYNRKHGR